VTATTARSIPRLSDIGIMACGDHLDAFGKEFENMGAQMVKEVASKTSDVAGDGTTTATPCHRARSPWRP
jgi:hypothetical protein